MTNALTVTTRLEGLVPIALVMISLFDLVSTLAADVQTANKCQHGGTMAKDRCFCTDHWEGMFCTEVKCFNGGMRLQSDECTCTNDNFLPPSCATCKDVREDARCLPSPDWENGVLKHSISDRHLLVKETTNKKGQMVIFLYVVGFIISLIVFTLVLIVQQMRRIYLLEGWSGLFGLQDDTRTLVAAENGGPPSTSQQPVNGGSTKPDVVVTQVRHIEPTQNNGAISRVTSHLSCNPTVQHNDSYLHALKNTAV